MRRNSCFMVVGAAAAAASCVVAGSAQAASVSATPSISAVVHAMSVDYTFSLTGTQHSAQAHDASGKVVAIPNPGIMDADIHFGDGQETGGDAGVVGCQSRGVVPLKAALPYQHTYAKPGTYKVTVNFSYCGDANNSQVSKTIYVTVGKAATANVLPPKMKDANAPVGQQGIPALPGEKEAKAAAMQGRSHGVGPKVQTDHATSSDDSHLALMVGGGLMVLGAGGVVTRRRMAQSK